MMDSIICLMEVGLLNHTVFLPDGTQTTVPVKDLPLYIVSFSQNYTSYSVKLVGHPAYAEEFVERIRQEEVRQYSKNIIDIEIIGGNN
jgi:hypothetical protein